MTTSGQPHFNLPNLVFDNRTQFSASQFDMVDQFAEAFHVVVARTGYTIGPCGADGVASLTPLALPAPLLTEDRHLGGDTDAGTLQESDFAPYKPRCDVIVNGAAHAPLGLAMAQFAVNLNVSKAGKAVIDKTLQVCGEHYFRRTDMVKRVIQGCAKVATLALLRPNPWRLSTPEKFTQLPLQYAYATGGQCRIDTPGRTQHDSCQTNPLGRGFARHWYLDAQQLSAVPAPRIYYPKQPCTAQQFWQGAAGQDLPLPAGLAPIGRGWLPRRLLAGSIKEKTQWSPEELPMLPKDFDFAYWNCTPPDQQCAHLSGQEQFTLTNLCRHDHRSARADRIGNTVLRFALPEQVLFLLLADQHDKLLVLRLAIDTVVIDTDAATLELVWRVTVPANAGQVAARLMHVVQPEQIARLTLLEQAQEALAEAPHDE